MTFWEIIGLLDWSREGNDEAVIEPVIEYLSCQDDDVIFDFDERLAECLYAIDGKKWAKQYKKTAGGYYSPDGFLYGRCVAVANGEEHYKSVLKGKTDINGEFEFESILYVAGKAWERKHGRESGEYSYVTRVSYETRSNKKKWGFFA